MSSNIHTLPVTKKPRRRAAVTDRQRAEVLQIVDHRRQRATAVETPEQKIARLERLIDDVAYQLLTAARAIAAYRS